MDGIGLTSLWVAAMRAVETERGDALVRDPLARGLAGEQGFEVMQRGDPPGAVRPPVIAVRTRFFDDAIRSAVAAGTGTVVALAAGMDSRAFRLELPRSTRFLELDLPQVLDEKAARLGPAPPRVERIVVPTDLRRDWPGDLLAAGFDPTRPAVWLIEGLLPYLDEADVRTLLARVSDLAALAGAGSELLLDVSSRAMFDSPRMKERLAFVASLGAPWRFATDTPEALLEPLGWDVEVTDVATIGASHGRWPFPVFPRGSPGVPQSFLVRGTRLGGRTPTAGE